MFQNATEKLLLIASTLVQWVFYRKRFPKDFNPARILVVKLDHIGDVLLSTPVWTNLRQTYPNTELHALTGSWSSVILKNHPNVDKVIEYNSPVFSRSNQPTSLKKTFALYRQLRKDRYDLLIELRSDWRILLFALLRLTPQRIDRASLQIANKLGWTQFSGTHETTRNLDVLNRSGIATPIQKTIFSVADDETNWVSNFFETHQIDIHVPLVLIHPGSPIALKRWSPERYAELADRLIGERGTQICFVGVKEEGPIIHQVQNLMQRKSTHIAGKTNIPQLAAILKRCCVFIGNDSGPMHLSAAVGTQTIGLFGPGDPKRFGPVGEKCQIIQKKEDCSPCTNWKFMLDGKDRTCIYGKDGCMSQILVEDVIKALNNFEIFP